MILGTVNTMRGAAVSHNTTMASVPMAKQNSFENVLAEEANFTLSHLPKHVPFMDTMRGCCLIHTPQISTRGGLTIKTH